MVCTTKAFQCYVQLINSKYSPVELLRIPLFQFALNNEMNKTLLLFFCTFACTNAFLWNNNQKRNFVDLWNDHGRRNYKRDSNTYSLRSFSQKYPDYYDEDVVPAAIVDVPDQTHFNDLNSADYDEFLVNQEERDREHAIAEAQQEGY